MAAVTATARATPAAPVAPPPRIAGHGTSEAEWRAAGWLDALPRWNIRTLLGDARRLVVVAPHPDDEVLGAGGLIAAAAALGLPVWILALTDGEACYPDAPSLPPAMLARMRRAELDVALNRLGVQSGGVEHFRLPDGMLRHEGAALVGRIHRLLQPHDLIATTWARDGHPDHEAAAEAVAEATTCTGCRRLEFPVWGWHWSHADGRDMPRERMGRLDLDRGLLARKLWAMRAFRSQTGRGIDVDAPILPDRVLARFRRSFEVFVR